MPFELTPVQAFIVVLIAVVVLVNARRILARLAGPPRVSVRVPHPPAVVDLRPETSNLRDSCLKAVVMLEEEAARQARESKVNSLMDLVVKASTPIASHTIPEAVPHPANTPPSSDPK